MGTALLVFGRAGRAPLPAGRFAPVLIIAGLVLLAVVVWGVGMLLPSLGIGGE